MKSDLLVCREKIQIRSLTMNWVYIYTILAVYAEGSKALINMDTDMTCAYHMYMYIIYMYMYNGVANYIHVCVHKQA